MRKNNLNDLGFSLLEILLAAIIFIITIGAVFITLAAIRKPVADKEMALSASIFGKRVLESLRSSVSSQLNSNYYESCSVVGSAPACYDFSLALGTHSVVMPIVMPGGNLTWPTGFSVLNNCSSGGTGCLNYTVSCGDSTIGSLDFNTCNPNTCTSNCNFDMARRVDLNINWPSAT